MKELLNDPTLLIGKRIKHRVQESTEEDPEWYDASVLEIDKYTDEPVRTRTYVMTLMDRTANLVFPFCVTLRKEISCRTLFKVIVIGSLNEVSVLKWCPLGES